MVQPVILGECWALRSSKFEVGNAGDALMGRIAKRIPRHLPQEDASTFSPSSDDAEKEKVSIARRSDSGEKEKMLMWQGHHQH